MEADISEISVNETIYDQTLNFVSWLKKQQEYSSEITKKNIKGFKEKETKLILSIEKNSSGTKRVFDNATSNLNLLKRLNHKQKLNTPVNVEKITKDFIQDYEQKLTQLKIDTKLLDNEHKNIKNLKIKIAAHKKAIGYYESNLHLQTKLLMSNENETIFQTIFENNMQYPVKMVLDKSNNILSFEVNYLKSEKEHNEVTNWFVQMKDPVILMVKLREYLLSFK